MICRDENNSIELNELNNDECLDDWYDVEREGPETKLPLQSEEQCVPPPSLPPPGVEESQANQEQAMVVPGPLPQRNLSSSINATNRPESENSLEEYPITTIPESQQTPPDLRSNDLQLVIGSTPPNNGGFSAQLASVTANLGSAATNGDGDGDVDLSPSSCTAFPNHVRVPNDNRGAEVNTVLEDVTDNRQDTCDLVTSERKPAVMPSRRSVADHMCQSDASYAQRYANSHQPDVSNLPNGLVYTVPNNNATLSQQRRYKVINNIPRDFCAYESTSSWVCPHAVAMLS